MPFRRSLHVTILILPMLAVLAAPDREVRAQEAAVDAAVDTAVEHARTGHDSREVLRRVEERWRVVPLQEGVLLVPRSPGRSFEGVELRNGAVAVDGEVLTGTELRDRLGADAETVLQLSYMDGETLRALAAGTAAAGIESPPPAASASPGAAPDEPDRAYTRRRDARVRVGGDLVITADEYVEEAAVAVFGSVTIDGGVGGDVVAVGGDVRLGPTAVVRGGVTAVGGTILTDPAAQVRGGAHEVAITLPAIGPLVAGLPRIHAGSWPDVRWTEGLALGTTLFRMSVIAVLAVLIALVAPRRLARLRAEIVRAPVASGVVGAVGLLLLVPALFALALALLVSLVGIPLLALMPLVVLAAAVVCLVGFTAAAATVGSVVPGLRRHPVASVLAGALAIWACLLVGRALWWAGTPLWAGPALIGGVGLFVEFVAWSVGLGSVLLAWRRGAGVVAAPAPVSVPPGSHLEGGFRSF